MGSHRAVRQGQVCQRGPQGLEGRRGEDQRRPPATRKKFDEKNSLGFPLLSDQSHEIADKYGMAGKEHV